MQVNHDVVLAAVKPYGLAIGYAPAAKKDSPEMEQAKQMQRESKSGFWFLFERLAGGGGTALPAPNVHGRAF
jgi:endonuclease YncB( thermonuclease family)